MGWLTANADDRPTFDALGALPAGGGRPIMRLLDDMDRPDERIAELVDAVERHLGVDLGPWSPSNNRHTNALRALGRARPCNTRNQGGHHA